MNVRLALPQDVENILHIYAQYIDTPITFEYTLPDVKQFSQRMNTVGVLYPWLIAEDEGKIFGYAYAHALAERSAYQWNAELSIYLDKNCQGKKLGAKLYGVLLAILARQRILTVYARITIPNSCSERFHEKMGFRQVWLQKNAGFKGGRWHDVAWFAKDIGLHGNSPAPFIPLPQLEDDMEEIFSTCQLR